MTQAAWLGSPVVLFGVGKLARRLLRFYREDDVRLAAVVDNSRALHGRTLGEVLGNPSRNTNDAYVIQSPTMLQHMENHHVCVVVAAAIVHMEEILQQLQSYGISRVLDAHVLIAEKREELEKYPIQKNKLLFLIHRHQGHDAAITEYLLRTHPQLEIVWLIKGHAVKPCKGVRAVDADDEVDCIWEMATAKIVFQNDGVFPSQYPKKTGQVYIQLKHWASITLKTFFATDKSDAGMIERLKTSAKLLDYAFVGSDFDERTFREGMLYDGPCIRVGSPRSDLLFLDGIYEDVRARLGIPQGVKLALYAPTFRRLWDSLDIIRSLDFAQMRAALRERFGGAWEILLRLHPTLVERSGELELPAFVRDVSHYDEGEELVAAADVMVSDYSSIIFESAFLYRPVFLYAPDKARYVREERGFLLDYDHLPFPTSATNEELCASILQFDEETYKTTLRAFFEHYGVHEDGHACERAAAFIMKLLGMDAEERDGSAK